MRIPDVYRWLFWSSHCLRSNVLLRNYSRSHSSNLHPHDNVTTLLFPAVNNIITSGIDREALSHMPDIEVSVYDAWNHVSIRVRDENKLDRVLEIIKDGRGKIISVIPQRETLEEHFIKKIGERRA